VPRQDNSPDLAVFYQNLSYLGQNIISSRQIARVSVDTCPPIENQITNHNNEKSIPIFGSIGFAASRL
jgi:hypothetical protein